MQKSDRFSVLAASGQPARWKHCQSEAPAARGGKADTLRFDRMNTVQSETMALAEGDALHVSWQIESGHVDIVIGMEGEEAVYRADDRPAVDKADFYVEIPQTGSYTITVSAREAKGQIEFMRMENEQREGE